MSDRPRGPFGIDPLHFSVLIFSVLILFVLYLLLPKAFRKQYFHAYPKRHAWSARVRARRAGGRSQVCNVVFQDLLNLEVSYQYEHHGFDRKEVIIIFVSVASYSRGPLTLCLLPSNQPTLIDIYGKILFDISRYLSVRAHSQEGLLPLIPAPPVVILMATALPELPTNWATTRSRWTLPAEVQRSSNNKFWTCNRTMKLSSVLPCSSCETRAF